MSQETNSSINNLMIGLSQVRSIEKEMNELAKKDDATVSQVRAKKMEMDYKMGKFDEEFREFLGKEGLPENFHLLDIINHFWQKSKKTLVISG